jgi:hypothetical protein
MDKQSAESYEATKQTTNTTAFMPISDDNPQKGQWSEEALL